MNAEDTLTRVRRMDIAALAQIHDRYYAAIYRYVRYRLDDEAVSEDIASEVFVRLLDALRKQGGPTKDLRSWLIGTASNLVNDHLRRRYSRKTQPLDQEDPLIAPDNPEASMDEHFQHEQLRRAIGKLTAEQQHVLALRFTEEFSLEETAFQMRKSVNAIKALQFRAIETLKRLMDEPIR
jgi:RNA polymerase sigma-70 factor, ECF subfamily